MEREAVPPFGANEGDRRNTFEFRPTVLPILSVSVFENNELSCALQSNAYKSHVNPAPNQLMLF